MSNKTTLAYIALGSNLGDREALIDQAIEQIHRDAAILGLRCSPLYETAAVEIGDAPAFINGVIEAQTSLAPEDLLQRLLSIEHTMGRERPADGGHASRTIDLDLLLFGDQIIHTPALQVPHPRMNERRFVLQPLADLCPDLTPPGQQYSIAELLNQTPPDKNSKRVREAKQWAEK
ncbi:MAG: 2-amino-4-hydroxy-6-hydroxymethyldihydropteridine diphosphokinase [Candidatus Hinthialibacter antarcticus]|nr:2-amino-4-hydroxy-6-hydroxymethyldihydropteridine diphosphokinase [Candidatus Hinthialibacter antarcticus]